MRRNTQDMVNADDQIVKTQDLAKYSDSMLEKEYHLHPAADPVMYQKLNDVRQENRSKFCEADSATSVNSQSQKVKRARAGSRPMMQLFSSIEPTSVGVFKLPPETYKEFTEDLTLAEMTSPRK